eukprot:3433072-Rhodomonas_salina.1
MAVVFPFLDATLMLTMAAGPGAPPRYCARHRPPAFVDVIHNRCSQSGTTPYSYPQPMLPQRYYPLSLSSTDAPRTVPLILNRRSHIRSTPLSVRLGLC